ncbi:hypothetical protein D3C80_2167910 [compost metagenome]
MRTVHSNLLLVVDCFLITVVRSCLTFTDDPALFVVVPGDAHGKGTIKLEITGEDDWECEREWSWRRV